MRFSAEWQDPGVSASAELKATFCLLAIDIDGKRVSRFFDERYSRVHDRIAMPAYPVAQGLARAWWSLLAGVPARSVRAGSATALASRISALSRTGTTSRSPPHRSNTATRR